MAETVLFIAMTEAQLIAKGNSQEEINDWKSENPKFVKSMNTGRQSSVYLPGSLDDLPDVPELIELPN